MTALIFIGAALILAVIDQITKFWIINNTEISITEPVIEGILNFTQTKNTGAAFSIFSDKIILLIIFSSISLIIICFLILSKKIENLFLLSCLSLIIAGGFGNLIDRVFRGYVVDFIDVRFKPFDNFAIFNLADCFVVIGSILFLIFIMIIEPVLLAKKKKLAELNLEKAGENKEKD